VGINPRHILQIAVKRSAQVAAPLLAAAALTFASGCRKPEMQRCIDDQNTVVDDDLCHAIGEQRVLGSRVQPPNYRYYYGGTGSTEPGTKVADGSFEPDPTHTYKVANSPVTRRGGFGSTYAPWIIGGAGLLLLWNVGS
jgi:hypothetical protein